MTTPSTSTPAARAARPSSDFCLPEGYREQTRARTRDDAVGVPEYWNAERLADTQKRRYQFHVYAWAARLIRARALTSLVDVGCGPAFKLRDLIAPVCRDVTGLDQPSAIGVARTLKIPAQFGVIDLEAPMPPPRRWDLAVCADVIEHLIDPFPLLEFLRDAVGPGGLVLLSTPERDRLRGRGCRSSDKPEHVREWNRDEFRRFLEKTGFAVLRSRVFPQDHAPRYAGRAAELWFRRGITDRSPFGCHAVLCAPR